jgi:L-ascorbate metabolism protein UlaG (beta-lactamase superfamily)
MKRLFLSVPVGFLVFSLLFTPHSSLLPTSSAQEPKQKTMTIRWYGQSFFQVETAAKYKFAFDPHAIPAFGRYRVPAEFVLISHTHDDHSMIEMIDTGKLNDKKEPTLIAAGDVYRGVIEKNNKQEWQTIDTKRGEAIRIRNVATYHDTQNGLQRGKNSIFLVEVESAASTPSTANRRKP